MNIPVGKKTTMLKEFHRHLYEEEWRFLESTEKDKAVLEEFPTVGLKHPPTPTLTYVQMCWRYVPTIVLLWLYTK